MLCTVIANVVVAAFVGAGACVAAAPIVVMANEIKKSLKEVTK